MVNKIISTLKKKKKTTAAHSDKEIDKKVDSIQITEVQINDGIIAQLESVEEPFDTFLNIWIQAYVYVLQENFPEVAIFHVGNHYIVVEDCIYIAHYRNEVGRMFTIVNTINKLLKKFGK